MMTCIRADSSATIGSGHLMRCLTLAGQFKKQGCEVLFVCRDLEGNLSTLVKKQGHGLFLLPRARCDDSLTGYAAWLAVSQARDAEETIEAVCRSLKACDLLVVDNYAIDEAWEKMLRPYTKKIMVIDDLANRKHDCDTLLDQNFHREMEGRYRGLVPEYCEMRLGPKYALLREEFYEAKRHLRRRDGIIRNLLVFYGGSDLTNETMKACRALAGLALPEVTADVVVGGSNPHREEVEAFCGRHEFLHYHCQTSNMAELMSQADLCLGAGGTATWERVFLDLPSIVTAVAENQVQICKDCHAAGLIDYLGFHDVVREKDIAGSILGMNADELRCMEARCLRMFAE